MSGKLRPNGEKMLNNNGSFLLALFEFFLIQLPLSRC